MGVSMRRSALLIGLALLAGCASQSGGPKVQAEAAPAPQPVNDWPTQARVEYVFQCMREHGGQNYDNLYHCSCKADEVAKRLDYQTYSEAQVFKNLKSMPGERGGVFRDPPQSKVLRERLKQAEAEAEAHCFVK
ncbi:hypothetical protein MIT9_P2029 [Methylomarinovum caldicuralii]|uniref:Lipoprotein n=2 Tax=Methylomarinovum caldicuralii TaxID=438856 RepID=A0AAU9BU26_9GAMM|nr:hypothetical protein MIT9_P2029 [Methylomarinovum caldicuralii]